MKIPGYNIDYNKYMRRTESSVGKRTGHETDDYIRRAQVKVGLRLERRYSQC